MGLDEEGWYLEKAEKRDTGLEVVSLDNSCSIARLAIVAGLNIVTCIWVLWFNQPKICSRSVQE